MSVGASDGPMSPPDTTTKVWYCKLGEVTEGRLADASRGLPNPDQHMRDAIEHAYRTLLDQEPSFVFSGWGAELEERERAVVENREPDFFATKWLEEQLHQVRISLRAGDPLPGWTPEQWTGVLAVKLGQAAESLHEDAEMREGEDDFDREVRQELAIAQLYALAAGALDAIEALGERWAGQDSRQAGGMAHG